MIKTARIGYKAGKDEIVIDITVKNNPNHVLAPSWELVLGFKRGEIGWEEYTNRYLERLRARWLGGRSGEFISLATQAKTQTIVLVCFCTDESRCHRTLAKYVLESISV